MSTKTELSHEYLRAILDYESETGAFRWKVRRKAHAGSVEVGDIAGRKNRNGHGYARIGIDGAVYLSHRLAFFWMTGEWPIADLDHVNGIRDDNRWANLRPANRSQNNANGKLRVDNTSGAKGVYRKPSGRWHVRVVVGGKSVNRLCDTFEQAVALRRVLARQAFGDFARAA